MDPLMVSLPSLIKISFPAFSGSLRKSVIFLRSLLFSETYTGCWSFLMYTFFHISGASFILLEFLTNPSPCFHISEFDFQHAWDSITILTNSAYFQILQYLFLYVMFHELAYLLYLFKIVSESLSFTGTINVVFW